MTNVKNPQSEHAKEAYEEATKCIEEIYKQNIRTFDNQILALSSGTLGLSFAFIGLVNIEESALIILLIMGWMFLTMSIFAVLAGLRFATSLARQKETSDILEQLTGQGEYEARGPNPKGATRRSDAQSLQIDRFNRAAFWSCVIGIGFVMSFVLTNVALGKFV